MLTTNLNSRSTTDVERCFQTVNGEGFATEREDNDDCFKECKIGSKDISDLVKKAVRAAEAEARAAAAPAEAIKAAGDSAAEVVKTAALEEEKMSLTVPDAVDYKGHPTDRSKTGGWVPAALVLGLLRSSLKSLNYL